MTLLVLISDRKTKIYVGRRLYKCTLIIGFVKIVRPSWMSASDQAIHASY